MKARSTVSMPFSKRLCPPCSADFFFFNDTATTEIYTLSLHDALPIWARAWHRESPQTDQVYGWPARRKVCEGRSEEHTSELQSRPHLVCRLLLEKKNPTNNPSFSCQKSPTSLIYLCSFIHTIPSA